MLFNITANLIIKATRASLHCKRKTMRVSAKKSMMSTSDYYFPTCSSWFYAQWKQ